MTRKKNRRRKVIPKEPADMDTIVPWGIDRHLDLIEEVVREPEAYGIDAPDLEEAAERILRSLGTDGKASKEAILDRMRAELREWRRDRPDGQLIAKMYQLEDQRRAAHGTRDSRRVRSHDDWVPVAKQLLTHIPDTGPWDSEREHAAVWLPPLGTRSQTELREYIKRSESIPVYFDALGHISEKLDESGEDIPPMLTQWRTEVASGHRRCPDRKPLPPHRPVELDLVPRDLKIQITIALLARLGVPPQGSLLSGCRIVSEAMNLSEYSVERIWKARIWEQPFQDLIRKYSKAIAERTGLSELHTTET